jgi:hypothetical protein
MPSVSFLLKEPSATKPTPIFAFLSFDGQRVKVYTGLSILPKQWLKAEQRAQVRGLPDNGQLNDALEMAEQQLLDCYKQYRALGQLPSTEALRVAVQPVAAPVASTVPLVRSLWDCFDEWIALARAQ